MPYLKKLAIVVAVVFATFFSFNIFPAPVIAGEVETVAELKVLPYPQDTAFFIGGLDSWEWFGFLVENRTTPVWAVEMRLMEGTNEPFTVRLIDFSDGVAGNIFCEGTVVLPPGTVDTTGEGIRVVFRLPPTTARKTTGHSFLIAWEAYSPNSCQGFGMMRVAEGSAHLSFLSEDGGSSWVPFSEEAEIFIDNEFMVSPFP